MLLQANEKSVGITFFRKKDHRRNSILILFPREYRTSLTFAGDIMSLGCGRSYDFVCEYYFSGMDTHSIVFLYSKRKYYENGKNGLFQHMISEHK